MGSNQVESTSQRVQPPLVFDPLVIVSNYRGGIARHVRLAETVVPARIRNLEEIGGLPAKVRHVRRLLRCELPARVITHGVAAGIAVRLGRWRMRHVEHVEFWHADPFFRTPRGGFVYSLLRRLAPRPTVQVFVHEDLVPLYGETRSRHLVLPNAVEPNDVETASDRRHEVLYVGRYSPEKGVDDLLAAWSLLSRRENWVLALHGEGERVPASTLEGVQVNGPTSDPMALMRSAAVLVIPSHTENSPYVALEAMESSCPIVATRVGDLPVTVGSSGAGWLAEPGQPASLAERLQEAIDQSAEERAAAGTAGRAWLHHQRPFADWAAAVRGLYTEELVAAGGTT